MLKDGAVALFGDKTEVMTKTVAAARVVRSAPAGPPQRAEVIGHGTHR